MPFSSVWNVNFDHIRGEDGLALVANSLHLPAFPHWLYIPFMSPNLLLQLSGLQTSIT